MKLKDSESSDASKAILPLRRPNLMCRKKNCQSSTTRRPMMKVRDREIMLQPSLGSQPESMKLSIKSKDISHQCQQLPPMTTSTESTTRLLASLLCPPPGTTIPILALVYLNGVPMASIQKRPTTKKDSVPESKSHSRHIAMACQIHTHKIARLPLRTIS